MQNQYLPTKTNLLKLASTLALSKQGQQLLEKKKFVLICEMEKYKDQAKQIRETVYALLKEGYLLLQEATVDMGMDAMIVIAAGIPIEESIDIKYKTIMGVDIPSLVFEKKSVDSILNYGFYSTTISLDKAVLKWKEIKENLMVLTELENTVVRLQAGIQKVSTRSNALQNVIIPNNEQAVKQIQNILEEKEREEFARLKLVKKALHKK